MTPVCSRDTAPSRPAQSPPNRPPGGAGGFIPARLFLLLGLTSIPYPSVSAGPGAGPATTEEGDGVRVQSGYLNAKLSLSHPALLFLGVDSLGHGRVGQDVLSPDAWTRPPYSVASHITTSGARLEYSRGPAPHPPPRGGGGVVARRPPPPGGVGGGGGGGGGGGPPLLVGGGPGGGPRE